MSTISPIEAHKYKGGDVTSTMSTSRNPNSTQNQLVNFSVRAQDFILKKGYKNYTQTMEAHSVRGPRSSVGGGSFNTNDVALNNFLGKETYLKELNTATESFDVEKSLDFPQKEEREGGNKVAGVFQLPKISNQHNSPFKGFLDISIVSKKLRKTVGESGIPRHKSVVSTPRRVSQVPALTMVEDTKTASAKPKERYKSAVRGQEKSEEKMSPKVLETWINETLTDAEHLDIPGVILKPEHKSPACRYQIDRPSLLAQGISQELVDRIYRALFVYSVGFYELLQKCLAHTNNKFTVVTALWKVFSILLEYCNRTDYKMLISEIGEEHQKQMEAMAKGFQARFESLANNEKLIQQNMETLQKYSETLEKERQNERQMRLKLEEEYLQNTKNHEEEVQLRMKFEQKLNKMHSEFRDLNSKYVRVDRDLKDLQVVKQEFETLYNEKVNENIVAQKQIVDLQVDIHATDEKINSMTRELEIKAAQVSDYENRQNKLQDSLDLALYQLQDQQKDMTEMKLTKDVLTGANDGLMHEKKHLTTELKETRVLYRTYETKCTQIMNELNAINSEYQELKRNTISHDETNKVKDTHITNLKEELNELKSKFEELDLQYGTLNINNDKLNEQFEQTQKELVDTVNKLHLTNKVRHETDVKLGDSVKENEQTNDKYIEALAAIKKKESEIEDIERKLLEEDKKYEMLEIKKQQENRSNEMTKKNLTEKLDNYGVLLDDEKETRNDWIKRYEQEHEDHKQVSAKFMQSQSELKEEKQRAGNAEIKLKDSNRNCEILTNQNRKFQDAYNESIAKTESFERELITQKEILKQFEISKKELVGKLRGELDTVEERFLRVINENNMVGEDFRQRALINLEKYQHQVIKYAKLEERLGLADQELDEGKVITVNLKSQREQISMTLEDNYSQFVEQDRLFSQLKEQMSQRDQELSAMEQNLGSEKNRMTQLKSTLEQLRDEQNDSHEEISNLKQENQFLLDKEEERQDEKEQNQSEKQIQTEIGMEYFEKESEESQSERKSSSKKVSKLGGRISDQKMGKVSGLSGSQMSSRSRLNNENNDSSTALGTQQLNPGMSLAQDIEGGLQHDQSIEIDGLQNKSPGMRSTKMHLGDPINEEEDEDNEVMEDQPGSALRSKAGSPGMLSKKSDQDIKRSIKSKMNQNYNQPSSLSGMARNYESNLTGAMSGNKQSQLKQESANDDSRTVSESEQSEETKQKIKQQQEANVVNLQLKESIKMNNKKVAGASSIRSLIRSAATRD